MADWRNRIVKHAEVSPGELTPNPLNWRAHPKQQADALAGLIETVGWVDDVIVNLTTGNILDGHLRVKLAQERNEPTVPVKYVELSEDEENLVLASFDPITGLAEMDTGALAELLGRVDMQAIEDDGLAGLLEELATASGMNAPGEPVDAPVDVDRAEELRQKWGVEPGDLWLLDSGKGHPHRLICGDCTDADVVGRVMDGEKIDCITTDPPYGVDYDGGTTEREKLAGDDSPALYLPALSTWKRFCQKHVALYLWYADGDQAVAQAGWHVRRNLIWNKNMAQYGALSQQYKQKHEPFLYCHLKGESPYWGGNGAEVTVWDIDRHSVNEYHPTQKPPALFARAIGNSSKPGAIVFDGFSGSGTTGIACESLGRRARMVEISPAYVAVALERFAVATGCDPVRVEGA